MIAFSSNQGWLGWKLLVIFFATTTAMEIDIYRYRNVPENTDGNKSDSVVLYKYMNSEYYSKITVGSPAKEFKVTFDTSWSDSWLPSQHCAYAEISCTIHNKYDSSKSSTYQEDGRTYNRANKELSLSGFLSRDNFHLAHLELMNQTFVEITKMSYLPFIMNKADGIIGLGFQSLSVKNTMPFFYNLLQQGVIEKPVFTFYMNRDSTTEKAGKLLLGDTERSHVKGNITFLPVLEKMYWKVAMDRVVVDVNNKTYAYCAYGCNATFDTSSNEIIGPAAEIEKINHQLHAKSVSPGWPYRYIVCVIFILINYILATWLVPIICFWKSYEKLHPWWYQVNRRQ